MAVSGGSRLIHVSLPPARDAGVEYLEHKNDCSATPTGQKGRMLVESVDLRFQSDDGTAAVLSRHPCAIELDPDDLAETQVGVTPSPLFLTNTNEVDVKVWFRSGRGSWVSAEPRHETFERASYLLIRNSTKAAGQVFVSFKQPEDWPLARLVERYAIKGRLHPVSRRQRPSAWQEPVASNTPAAQQVGWSRCALDATHAVGHRCAGGVEHLHKAESSVHAPIGRKELHFQVFMTRRSSTVPLIAKRTQ